ncbi:MAG: outer membrane lipoprotein LolB [Rhodocyclaceae bacterium]|jgi:outer membrane lipoprotein LolB|nr:outer membrane lipoprotein LolB [Rhodocyclaceae bacterium]
MRGFFASLLTMLVLAGCASQQPLPPRPPLADITAFALNGRIAVRQGETRHYVKIDWRHAPAYDAILLATPLGQGVAEIERDAAGARLTLADQRRFVAEDWGTLTEQIFGFRLPLQASARWLLGEVKDAEGWRIRVVEREADATDALPTVIELERDDILVRLKIDEWSDVR